MSLLSPARFFRGNVLKGVVDASLAANLPSSPQIGDRWRVSVAGTFEGDTSILPNGYSFTVNDGIEWNGTNWLAQESGSDVWITGGTITGITDLEIADGGTGASTAPNARTNLDVYSKAETDTEIDNDISTHNAVTTAHGISSFGSSLVDDADAQTARNTLSVPATDPTGVTGADQITNIMSLTQAEFDAIGTPNASTLYVITDATPTMTETQTNAIAIKYAIALG